MEDFWVANSNSSYDDFFAFFRCDRIDFPLRYSILVKRELGRSLGPRMLPWHYVLECLKKFLISSVIQYREDGTVVSATSFPGILMFGNKTMTFSVLGNRWFLLCVVLWGIVEIRFVWNQELWLSLRWSWNYFNLLHWEKILYLLSSGGWLVVQQLYR